MAQVMAAHEGALPKRWGWLEVDHPAVVISALKPGRRRGAVLRVFEATGKATGRVRARLHAPAKTVDEVNLLEDEVRAPATNPNRVPAGREIEAFLPSPIEVCYCAPVDPRSEIHETHHYPVFHLRRDTG